MLHKTARVDGNIHSPRLVVEDGAVFTGRVEMGVGLQKQSKSDRPMPPAKDSHPPRP